MEEDLSIDTTEEVSATAYDFLGESLYTLTPVHAHHMTVVLLYTGIDDLAEVKKFLKNVVDWQSLGLELGLLYPTLERIEEKQRGIIERCKMEMLAAWLQRQDNVRRHGVPSWSILKTALENIGDRWLASDIGEYDTRENVEGRELREIER